MHVLIPEQLEALYAATRAARDARRAGARHVALFEFLGGTGCRPSEAAGLRWKELDLQRGVVRIVRGLVRRRGGRWDLNDGKTHRSRVISLPHSLVETLREHQERQTAERDFAGPGSGTG